MIASLSADVEEHRNVVSVLEQKMVTVANDNKQAQDEITKTHAVELTTLNDKYSTLMADTDAVHAKYDALDKKVMQTIYTVE